MKNFNKTRKEKAFIFTTMFLLASVVIASSAENPAPGNELYSPTRLEWAALELQALHGKNSMTSESPLMITFVHQPDGCTVLCVLQYTADFQAAALKIARDTMEEVFNIYRRAQGWSWLRLKFLEKPIKDRWPGK